MAVSGSSVPAITATSSMTAFSAATGATSAQQSYTVSGVNLTDAIVITPPSDFLVSTTSGGPYSSSVSLTPTGGVVSSTPIYVVFSRSTAGTSSGNITHAATGATTQNVAVSGTAIDPTITTTGTLSAFSSVISVASAEQSYTVSGAYLAGNVTVTAPTGFQISTTSGSGFGSTLSLSPTNGTLASTTIYVRLYSATVGSFSDNITHASSGATTKNVAASGTVSLCGSISLEAVDDLYMSGTNTSNNYGVTTVLKVSTNSTKRGDLFKWNVSSIPSAATVNDASLSLYVTQAGNQVYNLYNMRRTWTEGTGDSSASGDGATWLLYDGVSGHTWGTSGAANTTSDREDTTLWGATTSSFSSTGSKTVSLNPSGIALVQGWIAGTTSNYGVTMQNYSSTTTSDMWFASAENTSYAGATLNINYCVPNPNQAPVITETDPQAVTMSEDGSPTAFDLTLHATDANAGDTLTWSISGAASHGTATVSGTGTSKVIGYTPSANYNGSDSFVVQVSDGNGGTDTITVNVTIEAVNDAPVVTGIPDQTIAEGESFVTISLDAYVADADNTDAEMTWSYSGNTDLTVSIVDRVATIGIPDADWNGAETITFKATDPGALWDDDAAVFTVTAENDAPVVTGIPDQTIAEGAVVRHHQPRRLRRGCRQHRRRDDLELQRQHGPDGEHRRPGGHDRHPGCGLERGGDDHVQGHRSGCALTMRTAPSSRSRR